MKTLATTLLVITAVLGLEAATCTFTGNGDGTSWSDGSNWDCGSQPDPSSDDVTIPSGFSVVNDSGDLSFDGTEFVLNGSLDMEGNKVEIKSGGTFEMGSSSSLSDITEFLMSGPSDGNIASGASFSVGLLKTDDSSILTINERCIDVTDKLENLSNSEIVGGGCINYTGSSGNFSNNGSGGIFGCTSGNLNDCSLDGAPAPIELSHFSVESVKEGTKFIWVTEREVNNDYFTIDRSTDGNNWKDIARIEGKGTTTERSEYEYIDANKATGKQYFRLKQTDYDRSFSYSSVVVLDHGNERVEIIAYPNPFTDKFWIKGLSKSEDVRINLYDINMKQVDSYTFDWINDSEVRIDLSTVSNGLFFLYYNKEFYPLLKI